VLLISAGLVLKSFVRLVSVNPGFNPRNVLTMNMELTEKYKTDVQMRTFHDAVLRRIRALPGVYAAGTAAFGLPFGGLGIAGDFTIAGQAPPHGVTASKLVISPGYFRSLEIPLIEGREFSDADTPESMRAAIVNRSFAQRFWPHSSAIGHQIDPGFDGAPLYTIVGVVGDVKQDGLDREFPLTFYMPYAQAPRPFLLTSMILVVRTATSPTSFVNAVRREIQAIDPEMPVFEVASMEQLISKSVSSPQLNSILIGSFAGLALVLAAVGIYGVMSYSVAQRKHEIGIRMALGGTPRDIVRLVVGRGLLIAMLGIVLGLAIAMGATRLVSGLLFGVRPTDAVTFVSVPFLLALVALVACYVPAKRAIRVDPIVALRHE
jgi:putative ABC transport system permease protein